MRTDIAQINAWPRAQFVQQLGGIFEHSPWVAETAWDSRPFADVAGLHAAMVAAVRAAPHARQLAFLRAHPELAGRAMVDQSLTAESANEQTRSGLTQCTPAEFARLHELNAAYKRKFGWPFILAVKHLDRPTIIQRNEEVVGVSQARVADALRDEILHRAIPIDFANAT